MDKVKYYYGIDVSKDTLDVVSFLSEHKVFENNLKALGKYSNGLSQVHIL